jgi:hypothetical protein
LARHPYTPSAVPVEEVHRIGIIDVLEANAQRTQGGLLGLRIAEQGNSGNYASAEFSDMAVHGHFLLKRALHDATVDAERGARGC